MFIAILVHPLQRKWLVIVPLVAETAHLLELMGGIENNARSDLGKSRHWSSMLVPAPTFRWYLVLSAFDAESHLAGTVYSTELRTYLRTFYRCIKMSYHDRIYASMTRARLKMNWGSYTPGTVQYSMLAHAYHGERRMYVPK